MYRIFADGVLIYNDATPDIENTKLISPSLSLKDNAAGSFEATIPLGNVCYNTIRCFDTTIEIFRYNQDKSINWLWSGRVLKIGKDFYNYKKITCEGVLAFLNDTVMQLEKIERYDILQYVRYLLSSHNDKVPPNRRIAPGVISTSSSAGMSIGFHDYEHDGENVLTYLSKVIEDWGLHARIRRTSQSPADSPSFMLDLLTDTQLPMSTQSVNFGKNLLDYSDETDWSQLVTAILPYGGEIDTNDETGDEEVPDRYTIEGLRASTPEFFIDGKYLINTAAVSEHGRIEQTVEWSDIEDSAMLLGLAEAYLKDYNYAVTTLNVTVLDLHYLIGSDQAAFDHLTQINCYSVPHGLSDTFIVKEMSIPFDNPENTTFSMTRETHGLYGSDRKVGGAGSSKISATASHVPTREGVLRVARENAAAMINMATNGYITLVPTDKGDRTYALTITNAIDEAASTQMWKWTLGGLMFQDRGSISTDWNPPLVAITMDGQIVATRITTGTLAVDDGNGGYLLLADMDSGTMQVAGFDFESEYFYHVKDAINDDNVDGVYIGLDGIAIGSTDTGLFKVWRDNTIKLLAGKTDIDDDDIAGFYLSTDGFSVGDTYNGLFKVVTNDGLVKLLSGKTSISDDDISGFYLSGDGFAVGDTSGGLFKISPNNGEVQLFSGKTNLSDDDTNGFYLGYDGFSVGQDGSGLFKVDIQNNSALIAGFNFDDSCLWTNDRSSLSSTSSGFYIGTDGLSNGNGDTSITIRDGRLEGYSGSSLAGYFDANVYQEQTGNPGVIIGGNGALVLSTQSLGVMDYVNPGSGTQQVYREGRSDTISVPTGSPTLEYTYYTYALNLSNVFGGIPTKWTWNGNFFEITEIWEGNWLNDSTQLNSTSNTGTISSSGGDSSSLIFVKGLLVTQ